MVLSLSGKSREPGHGTEVLLHVPAGHHFFGEEFVEGDAAGKNRHIFVIETVGEDNEAERHCLLGNGLDVAPHHGLDAGDQLPVAAGMDASEVVHKSAEIIHGNCLSVELGVHAVLELFSLQR